MIVIIIIILFRVSVGNDFSSELSHCSNINKQLCLFSIACWVTNVGFSLPLTYVLLNVRFSVLNKLHQCILVLHIYNFLSRCIIIIIIIIIIIVVIVTVVGAVAIRCKDWPDVTTSRGRQQVRQQTPHAL